MIEILFGFSDSSKFSSTKMDPFQSVSRQGAYFQASTGRNRAILMLLVTMKFPRYLSGWVFDPAKNAGTHSLEFPQLRVGGSLDPRNMLRVMFYPEKIIFWAQNHPVCRLKNWQLSMDKTTIINPGEKGCKGLPKIAQMDWFFGVSIFFWGEILWARTTHNLLQPKGWIQTY